MPQCAVYTKVMFGPYTGFTKAEMKSEWDRYKTELQGSGSRLMGSSIHGDSFQFGPRSDWTLQEWGRAIRYALSQVDPDWLAPSQAIQVRF